MTNNMGTIDRAIRLIVAGVLLFLAFGGSGMFASDLMFWLALLVSIVFAVTAVVGTCPLYSLLGIRTCRVV